MPLRLQLRSLRAELRYQLSLDSAAAPSNVLAGPARVEVPAPFLDEENLKGVTGTAPGTDLEQEWTRLRQRVVEVGPALLTRHRDVVADPEHGWIFTPERARRLARRAGPAALLASLFAAEPRLEVPSPAAFVWDRGTSDFFGHFVRAELPLQRIARTAGVPCYGISRESYPHWDDYRRLAKAEFTPLASSAWFHELLIPAVPVQHPLWRRAVSEIADLIRAEAAGWTDVPRPRGLVYLTRGEGTGARNPANETDLHALTRAQGGTVVSAELPLRELLGALIDADAVISTEGSHLCHAFFATKPGATVLVIQPPSRLNSVYKSVADARGVRYAALIGEVRGASYGIDESRLMRLLERARA